jgi:hypothetical protein
MELVKNELLFFSKFRCHINLMLHTYNLLPFPLPPPSMPYFSPRALTAAVMGSP